MAAPGGVAPPPSAGAVEWVGGAPCETADGAPCPAGVAEAAWFMAAVAFCDSKVKVLCISMLKKEKTEK